MKALDLLQPGETAIVLFTRGDNLRIQSDGTGESGNWKMNPDCDFNKVIIYLRKKDKNQIYIGTFSDIVDSREKGRYIVKFINVELRGETKDDWLEFGAQSQSPVQYIEK